MGLLIFTTILLWIIQASFILAIHSCGLYLKFTQKRRAPQDCILIQLSIFECMSIVWDMIHYKQTIFLSEPMTRLNNVGVLVIWVAIFLSIAALTMDRLLAVKLNLTYHCKVTNSKICMLLVLTWLVALSHSATYWFFNLIRQHILFLVWEAALLVTIVAAYAYISVIVRIRQRQIQQQTR